MTYHGIYFDHVLYSDVIIIFLWPPAKTKKIILTFKIRYLLQ